VEVFRMNDSCVVIVMSLLAKNSGNRPEYDCGVFKGLAQFRAETVEDSL